MCDTEVYTIRVDSVNTLTSNVNFAAYINIPLRNVVKAELLTASIPINSAITPAIYIYVNELVSKFNDRAVLEFDMSTAGTISSQGGVSTAIANLQFLSTAFIAIPTEQVSARTIYNANSGFASDVTFIDPIRQLKTLTITMYDNVGAPFSEPSAPSFLTFRFTCAKPNMCQYGGQIV